MRKIISILIVTFMLLASSCSAATTSDSAGKLKIVTTTFPVYDFVRAVAGESADITMLIAPSADVHSYDPTPSDIIKINSADLFVCIGGESDVWIDKLVKSSSMNIIRLIEYCSELLTDSHGDYEEHVWLLPKNSIDCIDIICTSLCAVSPRNADLYVQNKTNYIDQIAQMDNDMNEMMQNAKRNRIIIADRFPFIYLTDHLNIKYDAAIEGCDGHGDASVSAIASLINIVKNESIPFIYYIEFSNQAAAKTVSAETGAEMLLLHSCQNVTKSEFDNGVTYVSLMNQNIKNLEKGLCR